MPPDLAAITRKALAPEPRDRFASASAMADALDAALTTGGASASAAPAAAAGAAGVGAGTVAMSGVARPNPAAMPYPPDAYADQDEELDPRPPVRRRLPPPDEEEPTGTSPLVWVAGIIAILLLAAIAFVVFQLAGGGGTAPPSASPSASASPSVGVVTVPNFVGSLLPDATVTAEGLGLTLVSTGEPSDQPLGTILAQDILVGTSVPSGTEVNVTVASGPDTAPVPTITDLRESEALQAIVEAGLVVGERTDEFDENVPRGTVISQNPRAGTVVAKGTSVDYVLSRGPEPTPTPDPDTDPDADAHPDPDPHADAHPDPDGGADTDAHPDALGPGQPPGSSQRFQRGSSGSGRASGSTRASGDRATTSTNSSLGTGVPPTTGRAARAAGISGVTAGTGLASQQDRISSPWSRRRCRSSAQYPSVAATERRKFRQVRQAVLER